MAPIISAVYPGQRCHAYFLCRCAGYIFWGFARFVRWYRWLLNRRWLWRSVWPNLMDFLWMNLKLQLRKESQTAISREILMNQWQEGNLEPQTSSIISWDIEPSLLTTKCVTCVWKEGRERKEHTPKQCTFTFHDIIYIHNRIKVIHRFLGYPPSQVWQVTQRDQIVDKIKCIYPVSWTQIHYVWCDNRKLTIRSKSEQLNSWPEWGPDSVLWHNNWFLSLCNYKQLINVIQLDLFFKDKLGICDPK